MNYKLVENLEDIKNVSMMSSIIWPIAYKDILSIEQIQYMLNKYLSIDSIKEAINDGYTFINILNDKNDIVGFLSYKLNVDKLFLSKLYILPKYQNKGYASKAIEYLRGFNLPIELTVNKNNKKAYEKYQHLGFKNIKSVITDIGNSYVMDDYVMLLK
ncbi:MAG: GNAT family N-acetyltransferase [Erysipelotrichaceae bacterium]|nr:GNAT family N-acetyltransferase [Erysipelotrichaceae bacterium]